MPSGLEGVVAADTILTHTDRELGMLWVRGVAVPQLAELHGYEGTVALLWDGFAGSGPTRAAIGADLAAGRLSALDDLA
jgi:citrate synthase